MQLLHILIAEYRILTYFNQIGLSYIQMDNMNPNKGRAFFEKLKLNNTLAKNVVQKTNDEFDFLRIIKHLDKSLVLLSFMLDLPVSDVLCADLKMSS